MKKIELTQGKVALVDDSDYELLSQWKWHAVKDKDAFYARHSVKGKKGIRMHRMIMDFPNIGMIDHKDGDGLNNQRDNLRVCTNTQNLRNMKPRKNTSSKYKGVSYYSRDDNWIGRIGVKNKSRHLGYFESELEAAIIYNITARRYFGEYARVNIFN